MSNFQHMLHLIFLATTKEYEAFTDSISENEIGISNRKLQKFTKIIRKLQLASRNFLNQSCLKVNPVLELRHLIGLKGSFNN